MQGETPDSWMTVPHGSLPKLAGTDKLDENKWVAKLSALFRWYYRSWKHRLRSRPGHSSINTAGFATGCSPQDVVAQLREAVRKRSHDGKPMDLISGDVLTAFDQMRHGALHDVLKGPGLNVDASVELMQQL